MRNLPYLALLLTILFASTCEKETAGPVETFDQVISRTIFAQDEIKLYDFVIDEEGAIVVAYNGIDSLDLAEDQVIDSTFIHLRKMDGLGASRWTRAYPTERPAKVYDLLTALDGGYFLLGSIKMPGTNQRAVLLLKVDGEGELLWRREVAAGTNSEGFEMAQLPDGGLAISGNGKLIELDAAGQLLRQTAWPWAVDNFPFANGLCPGPEGAVVVCGRGMIAYVDGQPIWEFAYSRDEPDFEQGLLSVCPVGEALGGGYLGYGYRIMKEGVAWTGVDYLLVRVDASGQVLWEKTFNNSDQDWGYDIHPGSDGTFVAVGKTVVGNPDAGDYVRVYQFDVDGHVLWTKKIEQSISYNFIEPSSARPYGTDQVVVLYTEMKYWDPQLIAEIRLAKLQME
ncbi:MAG: PQQ-binding-like beta-propeller repeat protein [Lewinella sp.]|nr:PQQ-binding-like beta-propeller repeat protein [Lewinella sp.]